MPEQTIMIVDDHAGFRAIARQLLTVGGFRVVGEAEDGRSALELARTLRPQVILLDILLPDLDGFKVAEQLQTEGIGATIVLTSTRDLADYGLGIPTSGISGFLPKAQISSDAVTALIDQGGR
jgi:DNA-binding NarL/FixJ family response regulator